LFFLGTQWLVEFKLTAIRPGGTVIQQARGARGYTSTPLSSTANPRRRAGAELPKRNSKSSGGASKATGWALPTMV